MSLNNCVQFIGNVTRDVEVRTFANGGQVSKFGMAINTRLGKDKEKTYFANLQAFDKLAEIIANYVKKGNRVMVHAEAELDEWEDKDGDKQSRTIYRVTDFQFMDGPKKENKEDVKPEKTEVKTEVKTEKKSKKSEPKEQEVDSDVPF